MNQSFHFLVHNITKIPKQGASREIHANKIVIENLKKLLHL